MLGRIGIPELVVIFAIVLVVFGPKNLPDLGKTLGKSIKNFKDSLNGVEDTKENKEDNKDHE
jgi:sec-independent protein translocase protein tatA/E homolog